MGTALTLQAAVSTGATPVTQGSVTFYDGARVLAAVQVVYNGSTYTYGTANLKLYLGPGTHVVKAAYAGTSIYWGSTSASTIITVTLPSPVATTIAITSSGSTGNYTLNGRVTAFSSTAPTGLVSFIDQNNNNFSLGSASLDPATLSSGWQSFTGAITLNPTYAVLLGDLNGDGVPDLVTSNYSGTTISVLLGNGDGTFQPHVDYTVGSFPFGMAMGDLNGDGIPDLAVAAHNSSAVQVLLGNGDGTFQPAQSLTTAGTSQYVAMADFNRDGFLDLVTCSSGGSSLSVFLGNGDGTFQTEQSFGTGSITFGLAVADFNKDGFPDVTVSNNDANTLSVFLGNGNGTFQAPVDYIVDSSPTTIAAADLNADGNVDLVVGSVSGAAVSILLGNGDGTFQTKVDYTGFAAPWGVTVIDLSGDGIPDIVVAGPNARAVEVFRGNGDGTFLDPVLTSTAVTNYVAALGDLDGDGVVDLVVPSITSSYILKALGFMSQTATTVALSVPGGGFHNVLASYAGDANASPSTSSPISLAGSPFPTTLGLAAIPVSAVPGQPVVLTSDLSPSTSSGYTARGTVTFSDGGTALGSPVSLTSGAASLSKNDLTVGTHTVTARYSGDVNFLVSDSSSYTVTITAPQTITFPALSPVTFGVTPLTLAASASSSLTVTFSVISGPATVSGTTLIIAGAGNVVIQADQSGDSNYQAAPPTQRTLAVSKAASSLALMTSAAIVSPNINVTFTATVTSSIIPAPTGSAIFLDGSTQLATVAFNNSGVATYSTTSLAAGAHSITATYAGDTNYLSASSTPVTETVVAPDYSVSANPATLTIQRGKTGTSLLTVTPTGGFTGQVAFTCTGLPHFASCSFIPSTLMLPGDDAPRTVQFSLSAVPVPAAPSAAPFALWTQFGTLAFVLLTPRTRLTAKIWRGRDVLMLVLAGLLFGITACGGSAAPQVPLGTSTVTTTAATVGGSTQHRATITITITQ